MYPATTQCTPDSTPDHDSATVLQKAIRTTNDTDTYKKVALKGHRTLKSIVVRKVVRIVHQA